MFFIKKKTIDPICGMKVKTDGSTLSTHFQGKEYYFCAPACLKEFESDPEKYAANLKEDCCGGHSDGCKHDKEHHHHCC